MWEQAKKKELLALSSMQNMEFISIELWILEYLDEVQLRFSRDTYKEKKSVFDRLVKLDAIRPMTSVDRIDKQLAKEFLANQFRNRSGYAANKDRKNLATAWRWGVENIPGWPQPMNPFGAVPKFPEKRSPRYVPPEQDFWKVYEVAGLPVRGIARKAGSVHAVDHVAYGRKTKGNLSDCPRGFEFFHEHDSAVDKKTKGGKS